VGVSVGVSGAGGGDWGWGDAFRKATYSPGARHRRGHTSANPIHTLLPAVTSMEAIPTALLVCQGVHAGVPTKRIVLGAVTLTAEIEVELSVGGNVRRGGWPQEVA
jgi:hypothetical protein